MEPLLAFFATFVLDTALVQQIMRWDMVVLEKSPWYNEILTRGAVQGRQESKAEGKAEGWQDAILDILEARFGGLPEVMSFSFAEKVFVIRLIMLALAKW